MYLILCEDLFELSLSLIKFLAGKKSREVFGVWTFLAKVLPPLPRKPGQCARLGQ